MNGQQVKQVEDRQQLAFFQELRPQQANGPRFLGPDGLHGNPHPAGDGFIVQALKEDQLKDLAAFAGELLDLGVNCPQHFGPDLLVVEPLFSSFHCPREVADLLVGRPVAGAGQIKIDRGIARDPVKKGSDIVVAFELRPAFEEFDKRVGDNVLGIGGAAGQAFDEKAEGFRVAEEEGVSRSRITLLKTQQ